ncbi:hypothetical protein WJX73_007863 [Symbiochloris irregularis]|uniref:LAGLIDADG homing endonuclease n=1 Tax=Symbiochloris irregularis TaxID=706552 RepID=A0AAW1NX55_9CHLO
MLDDLEDSSADGATWLARHMSADPPLSGLEESLDVADAGTGGDGELPETAIAPSPLAASGPSTSSDEDILGADAAELASTGKKVKPIALANIRLPDGLRSNPLLVAGVIRNIELSWRYLGGIWDADGSILMRFSNGGMNTHLVLAQSNICFLSAIHHWLKARGIHSAIHALTSQATKGTGRFSYGTGVHILRSDTPMEQKKAACELVMTANHTPNSAEHLQLTALTPRYVAGACVSQ